MEFFLAEKGKPHVKSLHFRALVAAMSGAGTYIAPLYEQLKPELAANNVVKIRSGFLMHHGGIFFVQPNTYDEVTYMNGTQGMKRIDLVVGRYSKNEETGIEEGVWKVIQGTPAASNPAVPAHITGDMQNGDLVDECPLFELHFDGINVTEVKKLVPVTKNIEELTSENEDRKNEIAQLNGNLKNSGTSDDGSHGYIRLPDGTQICYGARYAEYAITSQWNSWYENTQENGVNGAITFAKPFIEKPFVTAIQTHSGYGASLRQINYDKNGITEVIWSRPDSSTVWLSYNYIAIGRWK